MRRVVLSALVVACVASLSAQQPTIRSSTDLISVDVQVVDRDGNPVAGLKPDQFEVEIGGHRRAVQLAELVRTDARAMPVDGRVAPAPAVPTETPAAPAGPDEARRQTFVIAVDAQTFSPGVSRGLAVTAQRFVQALAPDDAVGLYTYPLGPKLDPTTDHAAVVTALDQVSGQKESGATYQFDVRNSELVDWFSGGGRERGDITRRYCPNPGPATADPCVARLTMEIETRVEQLEAQAQADLGRLRDLINGLAAIQGRKVLVLVSAGLTIADVPGGRPDVGNLPIAIGEAGARANVSVYTLFVDNSVLELFSAERRQEVKSQTHMARDSDLAERWLDMFSGAAGGTLAKVLTGSGEQAFSRIVRETSAYYLLGVDVADSDRTGRALPIKVRVRQKGATVRHRAFVVVPKPATGDGPRATGEDRGGDSPVGPSDRDWPPATVPNAPPAASSAQNVWPIATYHRPAEAFARPVIGTP